MQAFIDDPLMICHIDDDIASYTCTLLDSRWPYLSIQVEYSAACFCCMVEESPGSKSSGMLTKSLQATDVLLVLPCPMLEGQLHYILFERLISFVHRPRLRAASAWTSQVPAMERPEECKAVPNSSSLPCAYLKQACHKSL